ncbi:hypothetical protein QE152_g32543 [Popillia japonica]|uniref:Uncharacterized protein n=1 Tax=Popillia japonica TaxID=7064 RepID=A0AAW1IYM5_POPJA
MYDSTNVYKGRKNVAVTTHVALELEGKFTSTRPISILSAASLVPDEWEPILPRQVVLSRSRNNSHPDLGAAAPNGEDRIGSPPAEYKVTELEHPYAEQKENRDERNWITEGRRKRRIS